MAFKEMILDYRWVSVNEYKSTAEQIIGPCDSQSKFNLETGGMDFWKKNACF